MADVHVIFPPAGGVLVTHEWLPVLETDTVFWHVYSGNDRVKSVRIAFDKPEARFFSVIDGGKTERRNSLDKPIRYSRPPKGGRAPQLPGSASLWGSAPPAAAEQGRRDEKYTIYGLDENGEPVEKLDPELIIDRPKKP